MFTIVVLTSENIAINVITLLSNVNLLDKIFIENNFSDIKFLISVFV